MDKEDFQAWKDSPATQWVMAQLRAKARRIEEHRSGVLYDAAVRVLPEQWAMMQVQSSYDAGYVQAIDEIVELEPEDIGIE